MTISTLPKANKQEHIIITVNSVETICTKKEESVHLLSMKFFREHIIHRFFSIVMMLHILNLSVDAADVLPDAVPEDLSFNEIESIVEFVLEDILHIHNALPEYDEQDETAEVNNPPVILCTLPEPALVSRCFHNATLLVFAPCTSSAPQPTLDILSPPPKA